MLPHARWQSTRGIWPQALRLGSSFYRLTQAGGRVSAFFLGPRANAEPGGASTSAYMNEKLRDRATCVLFRDGKLLLVADAEWKYMLPGGGVDRGEAIEAAAARELLEETGLVATRTQYLYVIETASNRHHVFAVEADGPLDEDEVRSAGEIHGFLWWDLDSDVPVYPHVTSVRDWLRVSGSEFFQRES